MWQDVVTPLLRYAINDVDSPNRYSDSRIQYGWLVGAFYVTQEFSLANTYIVDLVGTGIYPDPTVNATSGVQSADYWTVNLSTLRSAIIMIGNDLKLASNSAWSIRDVHMSADLREIYKANKEILNE